MRYLFGLSARKAGKPTVSLSRQIPAASLTPRFITAGTVFLKSFLQAPGTESEQGRNRRFCAIQVFRKAIPQVVHGFLKYIYLPSAFAP